MLSDRRSEYVLHCNRFTLLLILAGLLLTLAGSCAGGYYLGRRPGPDAAGPDPWSVLDLPPGAPGSREAPTGVAPLVSAGESFAATAPAAAGTEPAARPDQPPAAWCVQLAIRSEREQADREVAELLTRGLQARVETANSGRGPRYLVRLGEFTRRAEAEQYAAALANRGLITDFLVVEK